MKTWTPEQYWEYVGGLAGDFERDQMRVMMAERGLSITAQPQTTREALVAQAIASIEGQNWTDEPLTDREKACVEMAVMFACSAPPQTAQRPDCVTAVNMAIEACAKVAEGTGAAMFSDSEAAAVEALRADIASGIRGLAVTRPERPEITDTQGIAWFEKTFGVPLGDMPGRVDVERVRALAVSRPDGNTP